VAKAKPAVVRIFVQSSPTSPPLNPIPTLGKRVLGQWKISGVGMDRLSVG
jgi:hypothetical protein